MDNKMTGNLERSNTGLNITYNLQSPAAALLCSVDQLEFKTSLLEVVEELRICRAAESRYEEQISNLVVEKQELEWQKESLQYQYNALSSQHEEAVIALKKQFQTQINAVEEEKGKFQFTLESKEREISVLKEELKVLQVSKYNLEKKLSELEQKVHLQNIAKENQLSQLSKVEKRFAAISHQCGLIIQAHGKLEQNVEEAMRLNKKLMAVNETQENAIHDLKQELEKVTADLIRSKVTSQCNLGEDNIHLTTQQQQLQELKQKLQMEMELNKELSKDMSAVQEEKQEVLKLLQQTQQLLQRQELALGRAETELKYFGEKHQVLERDNELLQEKAKENEDKVQILERENEKSTAQWKKEEARLNEEKQQIKSELESFKKAHATCQEVYCELPAQSVQEHQIKIQQNILQHSEQPTVQGTSGLQTSVSEALVVTDSEFNHVGIHSHIKEIDEESNELDITKQENSDQEGKVTTDNTVNNRSAFSPDATNTSAKMPRKATDNEAVFVNEKECICVATVEGNAEELKVIHRGETGNIFCEAESAHAKLEPQCGSVCLAEVPVEGGKVLSDSADALGVCSADEGQQTDSIAHKFGAGKSDTNDKIETTQCDKGVFINEPPRTEARTTLGNDAILTKEVSANEVRRETIQAQNHAVSDLVFQSAIPEIKNEQNSILQQQQQQECLRQAITVMEENCAATSGTIRSPTLFHPCCKPDVSSPMLSIDQSDHKVPFENCIVNPCVNPNNKIDISVEKLLSPTSDGKDITKEVGSNSESIPINTDDQQKETNYLEAFASDSKAATCLDKIELNAGETSGNLEYLQDNMTQNEDCENSNLSLNITHSVTVTPNSQDRKEVHSAMDLAAAVESGQEAISKLGLCPESREVGVFSKVTENELKPIFINTALNPVAAISLDHRDETRTSEAEAATSKTTVNQCSWKFCHLPSLAPRKEKYVVNKAVVSLPFSLPGDKLEAPITSRKVPLTFVLPKSISEMSLTRPIVADSPSTKRVNDTFNTFSVPLYPKRNSKEDWNAIVQTFCDFSQPPKQEQHCSASSQSCKIPSLPTSIGHYKFTESSPTCFQVPEVVTSTTQNLLFEDECDTQYPTIKGQIDKIERFLCTDRLKHTRKRKAVDDTDGRVSKITPT
ncbi:coiled-coil domain-containing protein 73-like [Hypanus sabinus]|uniref:coiled-coil domain-containing protein 73-like n=1 Tax=Hypanus sabinus TaxID=79690 RepID=UPI0028C3827E|nr:coiled-coil domain-containing protein 73-like [Hypanus sabinus]